MSTTTEHVRKVADELIQSFQEGIIPEALAKVFIRRNLEVPSKRWTWTNRLVGVFRGHVYAAGFRQWESLRRHVKKGERCFHILGPRLRRVEDEEEGERTVVLGYYPIPVFGYAQTDGEPLPGAEDEPAFIDALPLIAVAKEWGIPVTTYSIRDNPDGLGFFSQTAGIGLAAENLLVWAHELIHAADHRLGSHTGPGFFAEVVAQLGGSVLLRCIGKTDESDPGFVYSYIQRYCQEEKQNLVAACTHVIDRTCTAVSFLLQESERLAQSPR